MSHSSQLDGLIPAPVRVTSVPGRCKLADLTTLDVVAESAFCCADALAALARYHMVLCPGPAASAGAVVLDLDGTLPESGWRLQVRPDGVALSGGDAAGLFYGWSAFLQLVAVASACGAESAELECGEIIDHPRYAWRGLMLDSARHFQSVATVREVIDAMAAHRLNVLHWHLTDGDGWRIALETMPELATIAGYEAGQYSVAELREIAAYAKKRFIRIVPEIDMPGHSGGLLRLHPELACDPAHPSSEVCVSNPAVKAFLSRVLAEVAAIFPDSPIIHLGGDEAETVGWEACPRCRAAMAAAGMHSARQLEARFMLEMAEVVTALGRRPMTWCTQNRTAPETIVQAWYAVQDLLRTMPLGNEMVYSVHNAFYFDYPATSEEPHFGWMPLLSEEGVYLTTPDLGIGAALEDRLLGVEACLWTEKVPEWRVMLKLRSRLAAFAEVAWSKAENRDYADFRRRKAVLLAAGALQF